MSFFSIAGSTSTPETKKALVTQIIENVKKISGRMLEQGTENENSVKDILALITNINEKIIILKNEAKAQSILAVQLENMQTAHEKQSAELISLQTSQSEATNRSNLLETQLTGANDELTELKKNVDTLKSDIQNKDIRIAEADEDKSKLADAENRIRDIAQDLIDTKEEIKTKDTEISQTEQVLGELEKAIVELTGKYEELDSGTTVRLENIRNALMDIQIDDGDNERSSRGSSNSFDSIPGVERGRRSSGFKMDTIYKNEEEDENKEIGDDTVMQQNPMIENAIRDETVMQENPMLENASFFKNRRSPLDRIKRGNARKLTPAEMSDIENQVTGEQPVKVFPFQTSTKNEETTIGGKRSKSKTKSKMKSKNKKHTRRHKKLGKVSKKHTGKQKPKKKHVSRKMKKKGGYNSQCHTM